MVIPEEGIISLKLLPIGLEMFMLARFLIAYF